VFPFFLLYLAGLLDAGSTLVLNGIKPFFTGYTYTYYQNGYSAEVLLTRFAETRIFFFPFLTTALLGCVVALCLWKKLPVPRVVRVIIVSGLVMVSFSGFLNNILALGGIA
jgi:hypothetical protein